jgi:hypothetical protein
MWVTALKVQQWIEKPLENQPERFFNPLLLIFVKTEETDGTGFISFQKTGGQI